jgi:hypothetical protein
MADVNTLEEKLAEVLGLAQAAQGLTQKVEGLVDNDDIAERLQRMRGEAEETERRATELADAREGKKTAILDKAAETKKEAKAFMDIYLDEESDELDGFEFLTMTEAGEVGHWSIVAKMNEKAGNDELRKLTDWALPIQQRHLQEVLDGSLKLAAEDDPGEDA